MKVFITSFILLGGLIPVLVHAPPSSILAPVNLVSNSMTEDTINDKNSFTTSTGIIEFDVKDVVERNLSAKVELRKPLVKGRTTISLPEGTGEAAYREGPCTAFIYVYDEGVPLLVDVQNLTVVAGERTTVSYRLLQGVAGNRSLKAFDRDFDMATDAVELKMNTRFDDASSIPGEETFNWPSPVLGPGPRWYRGELHSYSSYGGASQDVGELIRRAERQKLDFLAITDRNTLDACFDPAYKSNKVVLIPAMEWGSDEKGIALIYGPRTFPQITTQVAEAQAICNRVQAQGGIFAVAHPCFATAPWQWGLSYVNAVEVWCRDWRGIPPAWPELLQDDLLERKDGKLIHPIAIATATQGYSANGQANLFWDIELVRGLKASVLSGSRSATPTVELAKPVTYVYAKDKSYESILDGLRWGRTIVARDLQTPTIVFTADVFNDGRIDATVGGIVPLNEQTHFFVEVKGAKGKRLEVILNGRPYRSFNIKENELTYSFIEVPEIYSVYKVRLMERPTDRAFGSWEMLCITSPIYAQEIIHMLPGQTDDDMWVRVENRFFDPSTNPSGLPSDPRPTELRTNVRY